MGFQGKRRTRIVKFTAGLAVFFLPALTSLAGPCDSAWDGEKIAVATSGRPVDLSVPLRERNGQVTEVTVGQIQAFREAKARISAVVGRSASFTICSSSAPNAFATSDQSGDVIVVTIGMLKFANGDPDIAAAVVGHEYAHHTKNHRTNAQIRDVAIGLLALIAGVALDTKIQQRIGVSGLGLDLGSVSGSLVSRKFDRDQEREADEVGFKYMVSAGFNPTGAISLANRMNQLGLSGDGLFLDTHPGWGERGELFRSMIANSGEAQRIIARAREASSTTATGSQSPAPRTHSVAIAPSYTTSDAQRRYSDGLAAARVRDSATAVREFRTSAEAGYAPAQVILGYLYLRGREGLSKDEREAVRLFQLAADQGNALGQVNLGYLYSVGVDGLPKNERESIRLFRLAADQGNALGQANLGYFYSVGVDGLPKNERESVRLLRLAADQGNALGQANLGYLYSVGAEGLAKDDGEAVRLLRLAADRGNALGQANLGYLYFQGRGGLPKDEVEAARLYRLAADQGDALGQAGLATLYANGRGGLARDDLEAVRLYRLSAAQGNGFSRTQLGLMYEAGRGGLSKNDP